MKSHELVLFTLVVALISSAVTTMIWSLLSRIHSVWFPVAYMSAYAALVALGIYLNRKP